MAQTILSLLRTPLYHFSPQSPTILSNYLIVLPFSICLYASDSYPISLSLLSSFFCLFLSSQPYAGLPILLSTSLQLFLVEKFGLSSVSAILYSFLFIPVTQQKPGYILHPSAQVVESSSLGMGERNLLKLWTAINNYNFFLSLSQCPIDLKFCSLPHVTIR